MQNDSPHAHQPLLADGFRPEDAKLTLILLHGRGASAESILDLGRELSVPGTAALAPQAAGFTWYPQSFLAPFEANQPFLDSALKRVESIVSDLGARGVPARKIAIVGFSQGACLALEYATRHARRYAAVIGFTGGLIGPPGTPRSYAGSFDDTPVFLGAGDPDAHVPFERVLETKTVLEGLGAVVELRRYPGMGHTINEDELERAREILLVAASA